ncbi:hypothetical protein HNY73_008810 [Argiope bruennichi]|uniref:C3H1-type domain-containing protein n=2 Tax=Argiope bruennichi TaxID=94029 RepID=A0A8T0F7L9_ARGBR|nr:hypothetical protein HNY73_008810 [Argiope bruennichi]
MQSEAALLITKSLVADYDSSSDEDEPLNSKLSSENCALPLISASEILSKTSSGDASSSVFINPYRVAENYEQSILEKHVKMTQVKEPDQNRKVCFKFNKGKCKLGDKCPFLHGRSIQINNLNGKTSDGEETNESVKVKLKKRCGLKDDLVPPKKYMKVYNKSK